LAKTDGQKHKASRTGSGPCLETSVWTYDGYERDRLERIWQDTIAPRWTFVEWIEFSSAAEFRRFDKMPTITREEARSCDVDAICKEMLERVDD